jgi:hypothetical protein
MNRSIKILLTAAAFLFTNNAEASIASSFSESWTESYKTARQSLLPASGASGIPIAIPDRRKAGRGVHQIDPVTDTELIDLQEDLSAHFSARASVFGRNAEVSVVSRNVVCLLKRKQLIYPFHSFF